jgi:hypothetical protein
MIEKCLRVMKNLLENNKPNQIIFCQDSNIKTLADFFKLESIDKKIWSSTKETNVHCLIEVTQK